MANGKTSGISSSIHGKIHYRMKNTMKPCHTLYYKLFRTIFNNPVDAIDAREIRILQAVLGDFARKIDYDHS